MTERGGGCLCGACRYRLGGEPLRVVVCHCAFCQKATGGAAMIEPIFPADALTLLGEPPRAHTRVSEGSGKQVHVHFCGACGGRLYLSFERFDGVIGLYLGGLDAPQTIARTPANTIHIFLDEALPGTVIPAGYQTYRRHRVTNDGAPCAATVYDAPHVIRAP